MRDDIGSNKGIFGTRNDVERLSQRLRSRFMKLHLEEYTYEEFIEIVRQLLKKRYHLENLSEKIGYAVWNQINSKDIRDAIKMAKLKDIRDAIKMAKLTKSSTDVEWLVEVQMKYAKKDLLGIDIDHIFVNC